MPTTYEIVKQTRECERESRGGRVHSATVTTWDVVNVRTCSLVSEHQTKRAALAALAALSATAEE